MHSVSLVTEHQFISQQSVQTMTSSLI